MPVLQANEIRKSFKEGRELVNVLNGVSLSLEPGEVTALEGSSSTANESTPSARTDFPAFGGGRSASSFSSSTCSPRSPPSRMSNTRSTSRGRAAPRRARRRRRRWTKWGCRIAARFYPGISRVDRSSGSRLREHWRAIRRFCSRTSPPRISIRKWGCRSSICFVRWRNRRTELC